MLLPRTLHSVIIVEAERNSASGVAIPGPKFSPDRSHAVIVPVGLSRRAVKMMVQPSTPKLLPRTLTRASTDIAGMRAATTMPPSLSIFLSFRSSSVMELARISLIGIPLNISILRLPRTAAESCAAPSPVILFPRTSMLVNEPLTRKASARALRPDMSGKWVILMSPSLSLALETIISLP
ncbi:hypothetical protein Ctob_016198 [Chrysochromulina tobinii]|uniref:Uncharacterized protein n=1 Tax=Chrysochromulina tobinii TaxID=1460289 RepID=A0A0M0K7U2_9EUKA|nr:hypothetical protein Ctob_016198 [Chrysochromulina tobinii]|eukprot:KOO34936.1 hypothetical protein Ctob_016198 [Chrysochromulina sp. CCMP291]